MLHHKPGDAGFCGRAEATHTAIRPVPNLFVAETPNMSHNLKTQVVTYGTKLPIQQSRWYFLDLLSEQSDDKRPRPRIPSLAERDFGRGYSCQTTVGFQNLGTLLPTIEAPDPEFD